MPWMCGQLQVLRLDFKIGELVRHLAVNVTMPFHLLHPRPLQKQKAYHWRIFTPANNQTIWPLQWWIIAPAFSKRTSSVVFTRLDLSEHSLGFRLR